MKLIKLFWMFIIVLAWGCRNDYKNDALVFGIFTDCQYCACEPAGTRYYDSSPAKLIASIDEFNRQVPEFIIQTGDLIDRDFISYDTILTILKKGVAPVHHVLGNHDFNVSDSLKMKVSDKLHMPARYYSFTKGGWLFIALDGNDVSLYGAASERKKQEAEQIIKRMKSSEKPNAVEWNGAVGREQIQWFSDLLDKAEKSRGKVIVFCHFPVYPENVHNLLNDSEVLDLILSRKCVKAWINGHNHAGSYHEKDGLHFINFRGMVESQDSNAFALVKLSADSLIVDGYGREPDRKLLLR